MTRLFGRLLNYWFLAAAVALLSAPSVHARGIMLITHGESVKHLGDIAENQRADVQEATGAAGDLKVGYLHNGFGLFYVDVWTWDGRYAVYDDGDNVWPIDQEQAAALMGVEPGTVGKPLLYTFPPGVVVLGLLGAGFGVNVMRKNNQARALNAELEESKSDPRYQRAMAFLQEIQRQRAEAVAGDSGAPAEASASIDKAGFDKAVQMLADQGIPREEAERRLWVLWASSQASA